MFKWVNLLYYFTTTNVQMIDVLLSSELFIYITTFPAAMLFINMRMGYHIKYETNL